MRETNETTEKLGKRVGRKKGVPNKITGMLKEAIIQAASDAGGGDGLVGYLREQATMNPGPFMGLLGKVLPLQISDDTNGDIKVVIEQDAERFASGIARIATRTGAKGSDKRTVN